MTGLREIAPGAASTVTVDLPVDPEAGARTIWARRVLLAMLVLIVAAGATGLLGVRAGTVTENSSEGARLIVHYPRVARAGLNVPFDITVYRQEGFADDVTLAVSRDYLELFDRNATDPAPISETGDDRALVWHFAPLPGTTLVITLNLQVQAGRHWGSSGYVELRQAGRSLAHAPFTTYLAP